MPAVATAAMTLRMRMSSTLVVLSILSLAGMLYMVPKSLRLLKLNKIPYQFEWLIQSFTINALLELYTIAAYTGIIIQRPEHFHLVLWTTNICYLYYMLFMTKYTTRECEVPLRVWTLITHIIFGATMFYIIMDIFIIRQGGMEYHSQNYNMYNAIYDTKFFIFLVEAIVSVAYTIFTFRKYKYKKTVFYNKILIQFLLLAFITTYLFPSVLFQVYFIVHKVLFTIVLVLTYWNVFYENGRFLNE
jgi:hypothetical protein